ncbi:PEP-CTERM sorting domain-containing protein [Paludisphaera rhizosphaerae]|uniref:PEP-CTERM sorting domain-containing protein n=1 Tax=Paludisphaera rhizosphaerae TaxID=2711216 RepID=UPI0013EA6D18|nr:PEP-CTERM sorting domain-containing protein [Paludisphaera rhizosphaerae]
MDASMGRLQGATRRGVRTAAILVALAGLTATASATPLRVTHMRDRLNANVATPAVALQVSPSAATSLSGAWARFLAGGESTWASRPSPRYTAGVRNAVLQLLNGDPTVAASSPLIEYFVWRRNLDPTRFDAYHPYLGPRLPQEFTPPTPQVVVPPTPPNDNPLIPPVPNVAPPHVPEPSTLVVMIFGAAGALLVQRTRHDRKSRN